MPERYAPLIERAPTAGDVPVVFVCEHASNAIPARYGDLGLDAAALASHIAWDPGALAVAQALRKALDADLVAGSVSRLLYDCNRPPEAASAMPERSETYEIPGNKDLTPAERAERTAVIYQPFRAALNAMLDARQSGVMITVHSFTPIYHGRQRSCEIGVLHDADARLADAMLRLAPREFPYKLERNVPYSAADGVTHTLRTTAQSRGWPSVMLEIRNDLIATPEQQRQVAEALRSLILPSISFLKESGNV